MIYCGKWDDAPQYPRCFVAEVHYYANNSGILWTTLCFHRDDPSSLSGSGIVTMGVRTDGIAGCALRGETGRLKLMNTRFRRRVSLATILGGFVRSDSRSLAFGAVLCF